MSNHTQPLVEKETQSSQTNNNEDDDDTGTDTDPNKRISTTVNSQSHNKTKCGRSARRRKRKIRDIRQAVQLLLHGGGNASSTSSSENFTSSNDQNNDTQLLDLDSKGECKDNKTSSSCLPTDRNRSLPGAILRRKECNKDASQMQQTDGIDDDDDDGDHGFSTKDKSMLTSQLGFIPGNGISIVSRVNDIQALYPNLYQLLSKPIMAALGDISDITIDSEKSLSDNNGDSYPMVLQLYPLVTRDVYHGGKSDGRKFKSRKRGTCSQANPTNTTKNTSSLVRQNSTKGDENKESENMKSGENDRNNISERKEPTSSSMTIEPFPTMYWLTHPHLKALISQLEIEPKYNVKSMEERIQTNAEYLKAMSDAHRSYGKQRWDLLTNSDKEEMNERKWVTALGEERGVAGIRKFEHIKCLHAHAAHYLAYCGFIKRQLRQGVTSINTDDENESESQPSDFIENLVGKWVLDAVEELILNGGIVRSGDDGDYVFS